MLVFWQILKNFEWFYEKQYLILYIYIEVYFVYTTKDKIFVLFWKLFFPPLPYYLDDSTFGKIKSLHPW